MPKILDGAAIAAAIKQEVAEEVKSLALKASGPAGRGAGGAYAGVEIYVRSKVQTCATLALQRIDYPARYGDDGRDARPRGSAEPP